MKAPKTVKRGSDVVYFTITLWPIGGGYGSTMEEVHEDLPQAEAAAKTALDSGRYASATIRKEEVWWRDSRHEFSSNGPVKEVYAA